jgi:beta-galactosidase
MWRLSFAPGTLKAIGRSGGKEVLVREVKTTGPAAKIALEADRSVISADGKDLCFVTVKVLDGEGTLVPYANNLIHFNVSGEGRIIGVDNGLQTSDEPFQANYRKAFNGMCLVVIQSNEKPGRIELEAVSDGLAGPSIIIDAK